MPKVKERHISLRISEDLYERMVDVLDLEEKRMSDFIRPMVSMGVARLERKHGIKPANYRVDLIEDA